MDPSARPASRNSSQNKDADGFAQGCGGAPGDVAGPAADAMMPDEVLLDALSTPSRSGTSRGFLLLAVLLCLGAGTGATVFALMGAWPVLGFVGLEVPAVLGLIWMHRRRSARAWERVQLSGGRLRIARLDARGRRREAELEPYWTRVEEEPRPGQVSTLRLVCRGRSIEVGTFLSETERHDLADTMRAALRRHREPRFDNPQLRA